MATVEETKDGIIGYAAMCHAPLCGWRSETRVSESLASYDLKVHTMLAHENLGDVTGNVIPITKNYDEIDRGAGQ